MKATLLAIALVIFSGVSFVRAGIQELSDDIDAIETQIDSIDLDQSKEDIQACLDDIKQALEDLKGEPVVYYTPQKKAEKNYVLTPVDAQGKPIRDNDYPLTTKQPNPIPPRPVAKGYHFVWTESDNPKIGWHWLKISNK
jgi:hypothetical protein